MVKKSPKFENIEILALAVRLVFSGLMSKVLCVSSVPFCFAEHC